LLNARFKLRVALACAIALAVAALLTVAVTHLYARTPIALPPSPYQHTTLDFFADRPTPHPIEPVFPHTCCRYRPQ
jgi:hypothetical protein